MNDVLHKAALCISIPHDNSVPQYPLIHAQSA